MNRARDLNRETLLCSLPHGVQDFLPEECYNKKRVEEALLAEFGLWGYDRLETAPIAYYDQFRTRNAAIDPRRMFKMTDTDGDLVVLCPDITIPIARLASGKLAGETVKVCYSGTVFDTSVNPRVQAQAGVEFLGQAGEDADFEVMALALECLQRAGLKDIKLDIGEVEFFKGLTAEYGISEEQSENLRLLVDKKDLFGVELLLKDLGATEGAYEAIRCLPALFGGEEVVARARSVSKNDRSLAALDHLERVYHRLQSAGFSASISIDLGMVQRIGYYTGLVFRGLTRGLGAPVLAGGRYDGLTAAFGANYPATGFAVDVKKVLVALEAQGELLALPGIDVAVSSEAGEAETYEFVKRMRAKGLRTLRLSLPEKALERYCREHGIREGYSLSKNGKAVKIYG